MTTETHLPRAQLLINLERAGAACVDHLITLSGRVLLDTDSIDALTRAWDRAFGELQAAPAEALAGDAKPVALDRAAELSACTAWAERHFRHAAEFAKGDLIVAQEAWLERANRAAPPLPVAQDASSTPTVKQLTAQLDDYSNKWTPQEQREFAVFLERFENESSRGIIALGDAWKHGRLVERAALVAAVPVVAQDARAEVKFLPDMLWDAADPEDGPQASGAQDFATGYADNLMPNQTVDVMVLCATRAHNRTMRITARGEDDDTPVKWEWLDAAPSLPAVAPQEPLGWRLQGPESYGVTSYDKEQAEMLIKDRGYTLVQEVFAAPQQPEAEPTGAKWVDLLKWLSQFAMTAQQYDGPQVVSRVRAYLHSGGMPDCAQLVASEQRAVPVVGELSDEQIVATYESAGVKFQYMFNGKGLTLGSIDLEVMVAAATAILAAARSAK